MDDPPSENENDSGKDKPVPQPKPRGLAGPGGMKLGGLPPSISTKGPQASSTTPNNAMEAQTSEFEKQLAIDKAKHEEELSREREELLKENAGLPPEEQERALQKLAEGHESRREEFAKIQDSAREDAGETIKKRNLIRGDFNKAAKGKDQTKDGPEHDPNERGGR